MKHTITVRDTGNREAVIVWDDEAGTVEGDHSQVGELNEAFASPPMPIHFPHPPGTFELADPAHDAADFLTALRAVVFQPSRIELPESLADVTPTPYPDPPPMPGGADEVHY